MDKTLSVKLEQVKRAWHHIDVGGEVLGRQATTVASLLRGKGKPHYTPNIDCGDYVVVTNASQVQLTRGKETKKMYYRHSGYIGNLKQERFDKLQQRDHEKIIRLAVKGMLPKNKLADRQMTRLKIYRGEETPHKAQIGASERD